MMNRNAVLAIVGIVLSVATAALAQPYETPVPRPAAPPVTMAEPPLPGPATPNLARIYFYRIYDYAGTSQWTSVSLNGARVGDSAPGTYFYRDVQPGTYTVAVRSERTNPSQANTITVAPGGTAYVEIYSIDIYEMLLNGTYFRPAIFADRVVSADAARVAIAKLQYQP